MQSMLPSGLSLSQRNSAPHTLEVSLGAETDSAKMVGAFDAVLKAQAEHAEEQNRQLQRHHAMEQDAIRLAAQNAGGGNGGNDGAPPSDGSGKPPQGYFQILLSITKEATTATADTPHSILDGATAGQIHGSPYTQLMPRDYADQQNAASGYSIPEYHRDAPIINYRTDISTDNMVHFGKGPGDWQADARQLHGGHISPEEARKILAMPQEPGAVFDVALPIGTTVEYSRPISGNVSQFKVGSLVGAVFSKLWDLK